MARHHRLSAGFILASILLPSGARAQTPVPYGGLAVRPAAGDAHEREETLEKARIATATRGNDSLWNGALIGAGIGTGLAMWDYLIDPSEPGNAVIFSVAIGLGAAIGAGIDALMNGRGKVPAASARKRAGVTVSPVLGKDQQGVRAVIRF